MSSEDETIDIAELARRVWVLVVDDEPSVLEVVKAALEDTGYHLATAPHPAAALKLLREHDYNVLIIDKNLPGMDGLELVRQARRLRHHFDFVIMTGYASYTSALEAMRLGALDYIEKPFVDVDLLREKVRNAVARQQLARENQRLEGHLLAAHTQIAANEELTLAARHVEKRLSSGQKTLAFGQISAGVIHEVKNALTGVLGPIQVARQRPEKAAEMLAIAEAEAHRCRELLRSFLAFGREDAPSMGPLDCNLLMESVAHLVAPHLRLHNVQLTIRLAPVAPHTVGNAPRLQQALLNLVLNAQQAMPGGGTITLSTESHGNGLVALGVEDTGPGIAPELRRRIFEPFFTTKAAGEGTGLGLSIALDITGEHGGKVALRSTPGEGARFKLLLPEVTA